MAKTITVRSWLNADGFECDGKCYYLDKVDKLKEYVNGEDIVWEKGKNTFSGKIISDKFFESMIGRYYDASK